MRKEPLLASAIWVTLALWIVFSFLSVSAFLQTDNPVLVIDGMTQYAARLSYAFIAAIVLQLSLIIFFRTWSTLEKGESSDTLSVNLGKLPQPNIPKLEEFILRDVSSNEFALTRLIFSATKQSTFDNWPKTSAVFNTFYFFARRCINHLMSFFVRCFLGNPDDKAIEAMESSNRRRDRYRLSLISYARRKPNPKTNHVLLLCSQLNVTPLEVLRYSPAFYRVFTLLNECTEFPASSRVGAHTATSLNVHCFHVMEEAGKLLKDHKSLIYTGLFDSRKKKLLYKPTNPDLDGVNLFFPTDDREPILSPLLFLLTALCHDIGKMQTFVVDIPKNKTKLDALRNKASAYLSKVHPKDAEIRNTPEQRVLYPVKAVVGDHGPMGSRLLARFPEFNKLQYLERSSLYTTLSHYHRPETTLLEESPTGERSLQSDHATALMMALIEADINACALEQHAPEDYSVPTRAYDPINFRPVREAVLSAIKPSSGYMPFNNTSKPEFLGVAGGDYILINFDRLHDVVKRTLNIQGEIAKLGKMHLNRLQYTILDVLMTEKLLVLSVDGKKAVPPAFAIFVASAERHQTEGEGSDGPSKKIKLTFRSAIYIYRNHKFFGGKGPQDIFTVGIGNPVIGMQNATTLKNEDHYKSLYEEHVVRASKRRDIHLKLESNTGITEVEAETIEGDLRAFESTEAEFLSYVPDDQALKNAIKPAVAQSATDKTKQPAAPNEPDNLANLNPPAKEDSPENLAPSDPESTDIIDTDALPEPHFKMSAAAEALLADFMSFDEAEQIFSDSDDPFNTAFDKANQKLLDDERGQGDIHEEIEILDSEMLDEYSSPTDGDKCVTEELFTDPDPTPVSEPEESEEQLPIANPQDLETAPKITPSTTPEPRKHSALPVNSRRQVSSPNLDHLGMPAITERANKKARSNTHNANKPNRPVMPPVVEKTTNPEQRKPIKPIEQIPLPEAPKTKATLEADHPSQPDHSELPDTNVRITSDPVHTVDHAPEPKSPAQSISSPIALSKHASPTEESTTDVELAKRQPAVSVFAPDDSFEAEDLDCDFVAAPSLSPNMVEKDEETIESEMIEKEVERLTRDRFETLAVLGESQFAPDGALQPTYVPSRDKKRGNRRVRNKGHRLLVSNMPAYNPQAVPESEEGVIGFAMKSRPIPPPQYIARYRAQITQHIRSLRDDDGKPLATTYQREGQGNAYFAVPVSAITLVELQDALNDSDFLRSITRNTPKQSSTCFCYEGPNKQLYFAIKQ